MSLRGVKRRKRAGVGQELDLVGTPYYMAPEQIDMDPVDERTDTYSLGITAFEMFTGRKPFPGPNVADVLMAHREMPFPDAGAVNSDLPAEVADFIGKATQKNPADRYQGMGEVLEHLKHLAERYQAIQTVGGDPSPEKVVLLMSYHDVDRLELTRLIEDFRDRLHQLGVELSTATFQRD